MQFSIQMPILNSRLPKVTQLIVLREHQLVFLTQTVNMEKNRKLFLKAIEGSEISL